MQRLKVWAVERPGPRASYFGGNADEVAGHMRTFVAAFPERSLYLANYRGLWRQQWTAVRDRARE